jgi:hypothetical protein
VGAVRKVVLFFWHVPGRGAANRIVYYHSWEEDNHFGDDRFNPDGVGPRRSLFDPGGHCVGVDPDQQILDNGTGEKEDDGRLRLIRRRRRQEPGGR